MEASHLSANRWHRGGLQSELPEGLQWLVSSEPMPPYCPLQSHKLSFQPSATGKQAPLGQAPSLLLQTHWRPAAWK